MTRNDASNDFERSLLSATKYQSAAASRRWMYTAPVCGSFSVEVKSGAMPSFASASAGVQSITPFAHTFSARARTRPSAAG